MDNINKKILNFIKEYKYIILIFVITTIFFLIQHHITLSWDFISYVLNAKNIFNSGLYYETARPPFAAFIIGIIAQITGYFIAEIIFIILVNLLFCVSVVYISKLLKMNKELFYLATITPFFLVFGLVNGTELLFVALLLFGIYFILKDNWISGLFIGLSALSRYTAIIFGIFLLLHKSWKNKIKSIILFCITFIPWLVYSRLFFGNFFTSIADQFHLNVTSRLDIAHLPRFSHFISTQSLLFIFTFIGIGFIIYLLIKKKNIEKKQFNFLIINILILVCTLYSYLTIPFKFDRYLYALVLPIGYFTYIGLYLFYTYIKKKINIKYIYWFLLVLVIITEIVVLIYTYKEVDFKQKCITVNTLIKDNNWQDCVMYSDTWIYFYYLDEDLIQLPIELHPENIDNQQDKVLLIYKEAQSEEIMEKLKKMNRLDETKDFLIVGDLKNCKSKKEYNDIFYTHNSLYTNPCNILFNKIKIVEKICHAINFSKNNN